MRRLAAIALITLAVAFIWLAGAKVRAAESELPVIKCPPGCGVVVFKSVAGEIRPVELKRGDTLIALSARNGARVENIMKDNAIDDPRTLKVGQRINVDTRRIVPTAIDNGLVADIAAAMLYLFDAGSLVARYPAGFGSPAHPTPTGTFTVLFSDHYPGRPFADDIMEEKKREGHVVKYRTPPSTDFSLGPYWVQLSTWGMGVHPTPFSSSIGRFVGNNHIRVSVDNAKALFERAKPGMRFEAIYNPVRAAVAADGTIWLEAHPDVYGLGVPALDEVLEALGEQARSVDRLKAQQVLDESRGVATVVGQVYTNNIDTAAADNGTATTPSAMASWRCLDCPPGEDRRVTLRLEAMEELRLAGPFPIAVLDDAGRRVYSPEHSEDAALKLKPGEKLNVIWECNDSEGRPLPPGSYTVNAIFKDSRGRDQTLSLPVWIGK